MMRVSPAKRVALCGLLAAVTVALSAVESMLPPLPVPGARLGLSNVALTASMLMLGRGAGVPIAIFKVVFVWLTRGLTAAMMSACGTAAALVVTICLLPLACRERWPFTFVGVCVSSSLAHTLGQLLCATWLLSPSVWALSPALILLAVPTGAVTGLLLNLFSARLQDFSERT